MSLVFNTPKSALNTTSGAIQVKNGDNLQTKEITISEEGEFTVKADKGYYGLSQVDISVDVPSDVHNQNVSVSPETTQQVITPEEGYTGLGEVTVGAVTSAIDNNITAGNIKKDVTILGVTGNYDPQPDLEAKTVNSSTVQQVVTPTAGKDGLSSVTVEPYVLQAKIAAPSTSQQVIEPDNDKDGLSSVTISAVTSSIDANISAGNIKKDVTILGVTGNFDPTPNLSNLNITPSTNAQEYNPAISGVDGYSLVSVSAVTSAIDNNIAAGNIKKDVTILGVTGNYDPQPNLQSKTITPTTAIAGYTPDQGYDGFNYVQVNGVTSAIDNNIQAGNIKNGVSILGVTGNVVEAIYDSNTAFLGDVTGRYTIDPSIGKNAFSHYEVTVEPNPTGSFWSPFEVTDNIMMADVYNKLDEGGYFDGVVAHFNMEVDSGSIDSETGRYIAEDANGNSFTINPYLDNPDYDPEQEVDPEPPFIFPENFDLSGLSIQVNASFEYVSVDVNEPEDPMLEPTYTIEISECDLEGINWNSDMESWPMYWDGTLSGGIETSTRNLHLSTNEPQVMSLSSGEPWEIEIDQPQAQSQMNVRPLTKSGLRSPAPVTLEISQMSGNAGVFTLDVLSTSDQATGFTVRGLNSGNEVYVEVNSLGDYFTIESLEDDNDVTWTCYDQNHLLEYSDDGGATWSDTTFTEVNGRYEWTINVNDGDVIMFRGNNDAFATNNDYCGFNSTKTVDVYGNICSLLRKVNFNNYSLIAPNVFTRFFSDSIVYGKRLMIVNASGLILPSGVITERSLAEMFAGCRYMTDAPELPAKYVDQYGYASTFENCYGLTSAPEISATTIKDNGCAGMFRNCWNLVNAPSVLPADYLAQNCYEQMFSGCRSLVNTPELPATHLGYRCYWYMFKECTALETAPELPATTLAGECYGCMFDGCTSLETAPVLAAPVLTNNSYSEMFSNCSSLSEVTCLATDISASNCTYGWLFGVAASGTFYKHPNTTWTTGNSGVPTGWTVEDYVEE